MKITSEEMSKANTVTTDKYNLFISKPFAEIKEIKDGRNEINQKNELRFYRSSPKGFTLQIRTYKPITEWGKGKLRKMIANLDISIEELEILLDYAKEQLNSKTRNY